MRELATRVGRHVARAVTGNRRILRSVAIRCPWPAVRPEPKPYPLHKGDWSSCDESENEAEDEHDSAANTIFFADPPIDRANS